jgi:hypothetical protein
MSDAYRSFTEQTMRLVHMIGCSFTEPSDDWMPVIVVDSRELGIVPVGFVMTRNKDAIAMQLARLLRETRAERCAVILSAWTAEVGPEWDRVTPAAKLANRYETVAVTMIDRERVEGYSARIRRSEDAPPTLGEWVATTPENGGFTTGRFVTPLQRAMA